MPAVGRILCSIHLAQHPDFIGLLNHENARGAMHVRSSPAILRDHAPLIELIAATLNAAYGPGVSQQRGPRRALHLGGRDVVLLLLQTA